MRDGDGSEERVGGKPLETLRISMGRMKCAQEIHQRKGFGSENLHRWWPIDFSQKSEALLCAASSPGGGGAAEGGARSIFTQEVGDNRGCNPGFL